MTSYSYGRPVTALPPRRVQPKPKKLAQAGFIRLALLVIVSGAIVWGASVIEALPRAQADAPQPEIISAKGDYCLNDVHNATVQNAAVNAANCNGNSAQDWQVSGLMIKKSDSLCLNEDRGRVTVSTCGSMPTEQWQRDGVGFMNLANSQCLSLPNGKLNLQLMTDSCNNLTSISESWTPTQWPGKPLADLSDPSCNQTNVGLRVACLAQRQWQAWQTEPKLHEALLTDYTGGNPSEEWCADFVSYIYKQAGDPFTQGERNGWDEYNANNIVYMGIFSYHSASSGYIPKPGDVAYFDYSGGHVEIVVSGGLHPTFIYGDSGTIDPITGNGDMAENQITNDGSAGSLVYYLSPN